jgi:hypothetical protein
VNRRDFVTASLAVPAGASGRAFAAEVDLSEPVPSGGALGACDPEEVAARVGELRLRMSAAGDEAVRRESDRTPHRGRSPLYEELIHGFVGALAVLPELGAFNEAERATELVRGLFADVLDAIGQHALVARRALDEFGEHASRADRRCAERLLVGSIEGTAPLGTGARVLLPHRHRLRREVGRRGLSSVLAEARAALADIEERAAAAPSPLPLPADDRGERRMTGIERGLAIAAGALLVGIGSFGGLVFLGGALVSLAGWTGWPALIIGAVLMGLGFGVGLWLLARVNRDTHRASLGIATRSEFMLHGRDGWHYTGVRIGEQPLSLRVGGRISLPGRFDGVGPMGAKGLPAPVGAYLPGSPLGALVARVEDWVGVLVRLDGSVMPVQRLGDLWLAINVPGEMAMRIRGRFEIVLR